MAPVVAVNAYTKATVKNTFLEFISAEDAAGSPVLRRTNSSPCCFSIFPKDDSSCETTDEGTCTSRELDTDTDGRGSEDDISFCLQAPMEPGSAESSALLSDLIQIQGWPYMEAKKGPGSDGGEAPPAKATPTPLGRLTFGAPCTPLRTALSSKAAAYVPRMQEPSPAAYVPRMQAPAAAVESSAVDQRAPSPSPQPAPAPQPDARPTPHATELTDDVQTKAVADEESVEMTTVMLRNLPPAYTRKMLIALLESEGFAQHCDFLYLPVNFKLLQNVSYAFLNLTSKEQTTRFFDVFEGYQNWAVDSDQVCGVCWSDTQGLSANIERYRNSPIMRPEVPNKFKPALLSGGRPTTFPRPTKQLRNLRCRKGHGMARSPLGSGSTDSDASDK